MPEEGKAQLTWCWKWRSGFFSLSWSSILASRSLRSFVPLLSVFPSVNCSFLSFFSLFLWFWKLVLEKRWSVGFLFHCPPLYVPFIKPEDGLCFFEKKQGNNGLLPWCLSVFPCSGRRRWQ